MDRRDVVESGAAKSPAEAGRSDEVLRMKIGQAARRLYILALLSPPMVWLGGVGVRLRAAQVDAIWPCAGAKSTDE